MDPNALLTDIAQLRRVTDQLSTEIMSMQPHTQSPQDSHTYNTLTQRLTVVENAVQALSQQIPVINQNFKNHRECIQQLAERIQKLEKRNAPLQDSPNVIQGNSSTDNEDGKCEASASLGTSVPPEGSFVAQFRAAKKRRVEDKQTQQGVKDEEQHDVQSGVGLGRA